MSEKKHGVIGVLIIFFGALLFFGGFYLLPIGTDFYMYFWIQIIFHGNWLYGDIAANAFALLMMIIGGAMLWHEGKDPWPKDHVKKPKKKKEKSKKKEGKKLLVLLIVGLLMMTTLPLFSFSAQASYVNNGDNVPAPGNVTLYSPLRKYVAGTNQTEDSLEFVNNDAYESGIIHEPYDFFASIWGGYNNQRVSVSLWVAYAHVYSQSVDISKNAKFTIYQESGWCGDDWKDSGNSSHSITVSVSYTQVGHYITGTNQYQVDGYYANASFLTSSSDFYPGEFKIKVQIMVTVTGGEEYKTVGEIWGEFTPGQASVKDIHDAAYWKPGEQPNTTATIAFSDGKWNVKLWYGGVQYPPVKVEKGKVDEPNAKVMKDFGNFSSETVTLQYNFTDSDPTGVYVWIITSSYGDALLTSYSWTVFNNQSALLNGTNHPATLTISRQGTFTQGLEVTFFFHVRDDNSSTIKIWILAWWGNNMYQMPDPSTDLILSYFKPMSAPNNGVASWKVMLNHHGLLNLNIFTMDANGALNITRAQYYVDAPSGGGYEIIPGWFQWPWENTYSLILLGIGLVLALFIRNPIARTIGLVLIGVSFVKWDYVVYELQNFYNELLPHAPGVII